MSRGFLVPDHISRAKKPAHFLGQVAEGLNVTSAKADKVWSHRGYNRQWRWIPALCTELRIYKCLIYSRLPWRCLKHASARTWVHCPYGFTVSQSIIPHSKLPRLPKASFLQICTVMRSWPELLREDHETCARALQWPWRVSRTPTWASLS
jgi:hypothetical protein